MNNWILRNRVAIFLLLAVAAMIGFGAGGAVHGIAPGRTFYTWVLFVLCTAPLALMRTFAGRYLLLAFFMLLYFSRFGGLDTQAIVLGQEVVAPLRGGFLTAAETAILLGGILLFLGYVFAARSLGRGSDRPPADWSPTATLIMGLIVWVVGSVAFVTMHVFLQTEKSNLSSTRALDTLGQYGAFVVMLGFLLQPLGLLMLSYSYARQRDVFHTLLIIAVVAIQVAIGFVTDYKATAMIGLLMVLLVRVIVDNKLSLPWLVAGAVFLTVAFPVFQAYRTEVTGELGLNRRQAFDRIGQVLQIAWSARDKVKALPVGERPPTFIERSDLKGNIELLMQHAGVDVPFLHGATLVDVPFAFVPRILMPGKESESAAQEFSRQIANAGSDTYISISHLGELYWNFGWLGMLLGMAATGAFMGWVAGRFNFENGASLTYVMLFMVTVNEQVILFEGEMSPVYVVWMRSAVAIWLLHKLFAREIGQAAPEKQLQAQQPALVGPGPMLVGRRLRASRYPNVLP
jgi:hypothetical protein